jgi:hypothetical protein
MHSDNVKYPKWAAKALQGVAFWVGHRQSMYSRYQLSEGALTAELCNLIHTNLPKDYRLRCELSYEKFFPADFMPPEVVTGKRVDLSVWKRYEMASGRHGQRPEYVIEVKRANAGNNRINHDLQRLASVIEESEGIRGFLVVLSEGRLPSRFVSPNGRAKGGRVKIVGTKCKCSVVQVWKAARSFSRVDIAHYACLIEVVPPK